MFCSQTIQQNNLYCYSNVVKYMSSLDDASVVLQTTIEEFVMFGIEIRKTMDGVVSGQLEHADHSSFG